MHRCQSTGDLLGCQRLVIVTSCCFGGYENFGTIRQVDRLLEFDAAVADDASQ
ncbi:hypothetical protein FRUB_02883 [Fimbriiglobus ruber]|uniref:Uncharacterized protein n=1 Tax=Fimbriiglobus ruber TaxID=1908690 RepID=A0A225DUF9_9BACT|nr:hypothetical protein FRUB_02883 [Fimbriiglobus ruber]